MDGKCFPAEHYFTLFNTQVAQKQPNAMKALYVDMQNIESRKT